VREAGEEGEAGEAGEAGMTRKSGEEGDFSHHSKNRIEVGIIRSQNFVHDGLQQGLIIEIFFFRSHVGQNVPQQNVRLFPLTR
jgi:hypothetical protein